MKQRLFTPGPTAVPPDVLLRLAAEPVHHRHPPFRALFARVSERLQTVFCTAGPVLTLTSSGTGAMEAVVVNLHAPGDTVVTVNGGKFGARWGEIARQYGLRVEEITVPWGSVPDPDIMEARLRAVSGVRAVYLTHSETSTGAAIDLRAIADRIHAVSDALVCVDGITSIGAHEMRFDAWGIDACITASQKGVMIPPGLAFVALSPRAREAMGSATLPRFYFDLRKAYASLATGDTAWTPSTALVVALDAALQRMCAEGMERIWERHARLTAGLRAGVSAVGLELFSGHPSHAVTTIRVPEGVPWADLKRALEEENGLTVAGGQGDFAGEIFRIAHLGHYDELDILGVVGGLERALMGCRWPCEPGEGVRAAQRAMLL